VTRALAIVAALVACSKSDSEPPPPEPPRMSAAEAQRGREACTAYLEQVCACAKKVPTLADECKLARGGPEGVKLGLEIVANPDTSRADALQSLVIVRKTIKHCIEATAKLPASGC
jgi:hypothetical protein